jgi:hypothetical protein
VEVEPTHLVEVVGCYRETTVLGVLQTMNRKYARLWPAMVPSCHRRTNNQLNLSRRGVPWEQTSLYALWRAKEGVWLEESKLMISYSLEQSVGLEISSSSSRCCFLLAGRRVHSLTVCTLRH